MSEKLTACRECEFCVTEKELADSPDAFGYDRRDRLMAYWDYCHGAPQEDWGFDYLTGKPEGRGWPRCKSINTDGHCPHFKEKVSKEA